MKNNGRSLSCGVALVCFYVLDTIIEELWLVIELGAETPGVLQVMPSKMHSLHTAGRGVGGPGPRITTVGGSTISSSRID